MSNESKEDKQQTTFEGNYYAVVQGQKNANLMLFYYTLLAKKVGQSNHLSICAQQRKDVLDQEFLGTVFLDRIVPVANSICPA